MKHPEHQFHHVIPLGSLLANHTRFRIFQVLQNLVKCYRPIILVSSSFFLLNHPTSYHHTLHSPPCKDTQTCTDTQTYTHTHTQMHFPLQGNTSCCKHVHFCLHVFVLKPLPAWSTFLPLCLLSKSYPCSTAQSKGSSQA